MSTPRTEATRSPQKPRMLRDAEQVVLWLPKRLYARLEALHGPGAVAGLLSDLLTRHVVEQEGGCR